jgi:hypothetical protein
VLGLGAVRADQYVHQGLTDDQDSAHAVLLCSCPSRERLDLGDST